MKNNKDILFLMLQCPDLNSGDGNLYSDLALEFKKKGHNLTIIAPINGNQKAGIYIENEIKVLRVLTNEVVGVKNIFKKGIDLYLMPRNYISTYNKYLNNASFDWIFMPTPSVTMIDFVSYVKQKTRAKVYVILRDIHPQSFYGVGAIRNKLVYAYFNKKAKKTYKCADFIGCMSPENIVFLKRITPFINREKIVLLPNWLKLENGIEANEEEIKRKYGLEGKYIAIYGGNIGLGQKIENLIELAKHYCNNTNILFLIIGKGSYKYKLEELCHLNQLSNIKIMDFIPRDDYNQVLQLADVGIISLHENYTVPTCPSKIINYMAMKIPVVAMINDKNDYGTFYIENPQIGFWSSNLNYSKFFKHFDDLYNDVGLRKKMGESGYKYYIENFTSEKICKIMLKHMDCKAN